MVSVEFSAVMSCFPSGSAGEMSTFSPGGRELCPIADVDDAEVCFDVNVLKEETPKRASGPPVRDRLIGREWVGSAVTLCEFVRRFITVDTELLVTDSVSLELVSMLPLPVTLLSVEHTLTSLAGRVSSLLRLGVVVSLRRLSL